MSNDFEAITGNMIEAVDGKSAKKGTPFLGIRFETEEDHEGDTGRGHQIDLYFSEGSIQYTQEKIDRLFEIAGLPAPKPKPKTPKAAIAQLKKHPEEFLYLEIPITVRLEEYNDKERARYDLGFVNDPDANVEGKAFSSAKMQALLEKKRAEAKAKKGNTPKPETSQAEPVTEIVEVDDSDDLPF